MKTNSTTVSTIRLPTDLFKTLKALARANGKTLNRYLIELLGSSCAAIERQRIDAEFAEMANDDRYQQEATNLCAEFDCTLADLAIAEHREGK